MQASCRVTLTEAPFQSQAPYTETQSWHPSSDWPARWLKMPASFSTPGMVLFRCRFSLSQATVLRLHVTADERYELFADGVFVGRGSERGDLSNWYFETYDISLLEGDHTLVARVWAMGGKLAPWAQMSIAPGFLCCPNDEQLRAQLATGAAAWESKMLTGCHFENMTGPAGSVMGVGAREIISGGEYPWAWELGRGAGWAPAEAGPEAFQGGAPFMVRPTHWLRPASLPSLVGADWKTFAIVQAHSTLSAGWEADLLALLNGGRTWEITAGASLRVVLDLENYACAYPQLRFRGGRGGRVTLGWAEALLGPDSKTKVRSGNLAGGVFDGPRDELDLAGNEGRWRSHWWRCGRFIELVIENPETPLFLSELSLEETRYPFAIARDWHTSELRLAQLFSLCLRTWELCSHDTHVDCPYYEQLMYVGDARIQALLAYALSNDDRLPRKALALFDSSRLNTTGLVKAAHPSGGGQLIPPFALWWVAMLSDYAWWREDASFVKSHLPGARAVLDFFAARVTENGLLTSPVGWNFLDWSYIGGVPPGGLPGEHSAAFQAQYILALRQAAELEDYCGDAELSARWRRMSAAATDAFQAAFWNEERGVFADDVAHESFSEHPQCLALLTGVATARQERRILQALAGGQPLTRVSSYFAHYLFEATLHRTGGTLFFDRLGPWFACLDEGFHTLPETFGETRSDCHAWSSHPLLHYKTGILGVRPESMGFARVRIAPHLGPLTKASGTVPHPKGTITVSLRRDGSRLTAEITLPPDLHGRFIAGGIETPLRPGHQELSIHRSAESRKSR